MMTVQALRMDMERREARRRENHRQAMWECYHYSVNRQDRKLTIRNIMKYGFSAREALEMVHDCEREGD